jgi:hypothetical protein
MSSPTGVIPEDLMYPAKVGEVMQFIKNLAIPGEDKKSLLFGWARTVGVRLAPSQYRAVFVTGTDHWSKPE